MSASSPPLLAVHGLGFRLPEGRTLFAGLTLGFGREATAVVGPNGSGKSTLLELLAGTRLPTRGTVVRHGRLAHLTRTTPPQGSSRVVDLLAVGPEWDALSRLLAGTGSPSDLARADRHWDLPERIARVLETLGLAGLPPDRPAGQLSGGEADRVALGGLVLAEPDLLLLDEPTTHLDRSSRRAFLEWMEGWSGGLVVASHDRALLRRVDRVVELGSGDSPHIVSGALEAWLRDRTLREAAARRALEVARNERAAARREATAARERQARRSASGARRARRGGVPKVLLGAQKRRAEATSGKIASQGDDSVAEAEQAVRDAAARVVERRTIRVPLPTAGLHSSREVMRAEGLQVEGLFGPLDFTWEGPLRIALVGPNGSGKSTLLEILARAAGLRTDCRAHTGSIPTSLPSARTGTVSTSPTCGRLAHSGSISTSLPSDRVAYIAQEIPLRSDATVLEHLRSLHPGADEAWIRTVLDRFLFRGPAVDTPIEGLSDGERVRVALAGILAGSRPPLLLLLDEPTSHLDFDAVEALEAILSEFDGALVVASHDTDFLRAIGCGLEVDLDG